ncbi:MAG: M1 family metallopeptidase [Candidatus Nomurabacteria bacterium]|nr:M1 family metallopeptidase [Candidatus Nomurabacteria bacterium]
MQKKTTKKINVRLATHIMPIHYEITLRPDLEAHVFSGEEIITISTDKAVSEITLHSKELHIESAEVVLGKEKIQTKKITYNEKLETATFIFPKQIKKGKLKLHIIFRGILADNMRGFYKSKYVVDGKERFMATTQFEATDARRCIPCFDEPTHKAVFLVHLIIPSDKTAISNTLPAIVKEHSAGFKIVSFDETPKMSTYLLAFIVGDFEWLEKKTRTGVKVRVMTVPGKKEQGTFALDVTVKCLEFYEKYFDIKYPLDTLDMLAIPDFASGAMENWGAVTFRETCLLVDEKNTSTATKEYVAIVVAHELAHQWFGNLVTMEWWTHLWLNEGFASYIPYLAIDEFFPSWKIWDKFATDDLAIALKLDALSNTHPIEVDVHNPNQIGEIFDAVSYSKGATVIRMLAEYIGEKNFRDGLRYYLKKHSYKNASTIHLWDAFEKVSKKPIKKMMAIWTGKSGYPVISIKEKGNKLEISQQRHYSSETSRKENKDKTVWPIPLSFITKRDTNKFPLMTSKKISIMKPADTWFKANSNETGLYRTNYDKKFLIDLITPIENKALSSVDRLGIIRDQFSLSESGIISTTDALETCLLYKKEDTLIVWTEVISGLRYIANILAGTKAEENFRVYAREILKEIVLEVGFESIESEGHNESLLRPLVLGASSYFGDTDTISKMKIIFENRKNKIINPDIRSIIYGTIVREGGEKEYNEILEMFNTETMHEEKNRLLGALGATRNKKLLQKTLDFIMTDKVRLQDRNSAFASVLVNTHGREIGWEFLKRNWDKIGKAYGDGNHLLARLVSVLNRNTTKEALNDIKKFFKTHSAPSAERTILQTLEHIDSNIKWLKRDEKNIENWLMNIKY